MNRKSVLLWWCCAMVLRCSIAQSPYLPYKNKYQWGYIDTTGQVQLSARFDAASVYDTHGYAVIRKNNLYGVLDSNLELVIPTSYQKVKVLGKQLLVADSLGSKCYYLPLKKIKSPCLFNDVQVIYRSKYFFQATRSNKANIFNNQGEKILETEGYWVDYVDSLFIVYDEFKGVYALDGEEILPKQYIDVMVRDSLLFLKNRFNRMGVSDRKGDFIIKPHWDSVSFFLYDRSKIEVHQHLKKGLFDLKTSRYLFTASYEAIRKTREGNYLLSKDFLLGVADSTGQIKIPIAFDRVRYNGQNTYLVMKNKKMGLMSSLGDTLLLPKYERIYPFVNKPITLVHYQGKKGVVNSSGEWIAEAVYDSVFINGYAIKTYKDGVLKHIEVTEDGKVKQMRKLQRFKTLTIDKRETTEVDTGSIMVTRQRLGNSTNVRVTELSRGIDVELTEEEGLFGIYDHTRNRTLAATQFLSIDLQGFKNRNVVIARHMSGRYCLISINGKLTFNYEYKGPDDTRPDKHVINALYPTDSTFLIVQVSGKTYRRGYVGVLDKNGQFLIEPQFLETSGNANGVFIFKSPTGWGAMNVLKDTIVPFDFGHVTFLEGSDDKLFKTKVNEKLVGFADHKGRQITEVDFKQARSFHENRAAVKIGYRWTFVDRQGNLLTAPHFDKVKDFHEGIAAVRYRNRWGFIDSLGRYVINPSFEDAGDVNGGIAPVKIDKLYGYISMDSNWVVNPTHTRCFPFQGDYAFAKKKKKYGLLDRKGNWKVRPAYYKGIVAEQEFRLVKGKKYVVVNKDGDVLLKGKYMKLGPLEQEHYIFRSKKGKYGLLNMHGEVVVEPVYLSIKSPTAHRWAVKKVSGWGFIDSTGLEIIPCVYTRVNAYREGYAWVLDKKREKLINMDGREYGIENAQHLSDVSEGWVTVSTSEYKDYLINIHSNETLFPSYDFVYPFKDSVAIVGYEKKKDKVYGMMDLSGTEILSAYYDKIMKSDDDYQLRLSNFYGIYSIREKEVVSPDFESIKLVTPTILRVEKGGKIGYLKLNGDWVWKPQK